MLNNITIKTKLIVLAIMVSIGFLSIVLLENYDIKELQRLNNMERTVKNLNIDMLQLRKYEKDFLTRKDMKYSKDFQHTIDEIDKDSNNLNTMLISFELNTKDANRFNIIIHEYNSIFMQLVKTQQDIGLNHNNGLYGSLRSTVQQVQEYAKKANDPNLLSIIYDLRKQEKDFMLRNDKKYLRSFNSKLDNLLSYSEYESMSTLLNKYKIDFNKLVQFEEKKGLNSKLGLLGDMRKVIHQSEESLKNITSTIDIAVKEKIANIQMFATVFAIIIALFVLFTLLYISKTITVSLIDFEKGLIQFFSFINNENKNVEMLNDKNSDEIGNMAKIINKNIANTKINIEKDRALIDDATAVANKIKVGHLQERITKESSSEELNDLKIVINEMLENLNINIDNILTVLASYSTYNFLPKVQTSKIEGEVLELCKGVNFLGESTTKMLLTNKAIGLGLSNSAEILVSNVAHLNTNANSTAASLEETASALEEITATVVSNNESIQQMSNYAQEVTVSVKKGEELANQTSQSMDEINEQVSSINDSIGLIDQIAFQTNILSLNAAVEAATAGEAGKGFAVVAAEVRNLASRSAEVAKDIKILVQNASTKASEGKEIANNMIEGYSSLNENIQNTITIIADVSAASKEQQSGIEQINDAVTQVDQQTQQIAMIAGETKEIAEQTNVISNDIVKDANKKEFAGKDSVKAIEKSKIVHNEKIKEETHVEMKKPKRKISAPVRIEDNTKNDESWESF